MIKVYSPFGIWHVFLYSIYTNIYHFLSTFTSVIHCQLTWRATNNFKLCVVHSDSHTRIIIVITIVTIYCCYVNRTWDTITHFRCGLCNSQCRRLKLKLKLEQSDSDKGPRLMPAAKKGISVLAKILIIILLTKSIFRRE